MFLFSMKKHLIATILFYVPSLLWAESVMGGVCDGPRCPGTGSMAESELVFVSELFTGDTSKDNHSPGQWLSLCICKGSNWNWLLEMYVFIFLFWFNLRILWVCLQFNAFNAFVLLLYVFYERGCGLHILPTLVSSTGAGEGGGKDRYRSHRCHYTWGTEVEKMLSTTRISPKCLKRTVGVQQARTITKLCRKVCSVLSSVSQIYVPMPL